jgi:hypothetical protein
MTTPKAKRLFFFRIERSLILKIICAWFLAQAAWFGPMESLADDNEILEENPPSNEEFLRKSISSLLADTLDDFPEADSELLLLQAEEAQPANWLLEEELVSYLLSLNYRVVLHSNKTRSNLPESKTLFYRIIEMSLDYPEIKRKSFLGGRMLIRRSRLNLSFQLEDEATGQVLWTRRGQQERSDLIKRSMVKSLNNRSYPFLSPPLPDDTHSRFLEPALVAVVVGGLIYLFFANR